MTIYGALPRAAYRQQPRRTPRSLGFERYALCLDGVANHVDCGSDGSLDDIPLKTMEVLFKANGWGESNNGRLLAKQTAANNVGFNSFLALTIKSFELFAAFSTTKGRWAAPNNSIELNKWYHTVIIYDHSSVVNDAIFYLNGELVATSEVSTPVGVYVSDAAESLLIGRWDTVFRAFDGLIALVRIYDCALTQYEVRWNMRNYHNPVRPGNLRLWLPMEEGAGLVVNDHSGLGNNGSLLPALTPPTWERVKQWELRAQIK